MKANFNFSKRTKILAVTAAALAVVCAAQFLLGLRSPRKAFKIKGEADFISVESAGKTTILQKGDGFWLCGGEELDKNKVDFLIKSLNPIATLGVTSRSASQSALERYGLDKPIKVVLKEKDKTLVEVSIGKNSASGSQSYVQINGKKEIYLARGNLRSSWELKIDALKPDPQTDSDEQGPSASDAEQSGSSDGKSEA